jgi:arylsulfatase A-like enzyme
MWCAPSRSALLTGLYPAHNGVYGHSGSLYAMPSALKLLPEFLKSRGAYRTAAVGKVRSTLARERGLFGCGACVVAPRVLRL